MRRKTTLCPTLWQCIFQPIQEGILDCSLTYKRMLDPFVFYRKGDDVMTGYFVYKKDITSFHEVRQNHHAQ